MQCAIGVFREARDPTLASSARGERTTLPHPLSQGPNARRWFGQMYRHSVRRLCHHRLNQARLHRPRTRSYLSNHPDARWKCTRRAICRADPPGAGPRIASVPPGPCTDKNSRCEPVVGRQEISSTKQWSGSLRTDVPIIGTITCRFPMKGSGNAVKKFSPRRGHSR
jgi:hypothetical protein